MARASTDVNNIEDYGKLISDKAEKSIRNLFTLFQNSRVKPPIKASTNSIKETSKISESAVKLKSMLNIETNAYSSVENTELHREKKSLEDISKFTIKQKSHSVEDFTKLCQFEKEKASIFAEENVLLKKQNQILLEKLAEVISENKCLKDFSTSYQACSVENQDKENILQDEIKQMSEIKIKSLQTQIEFLRNEKASLFEDNKQLNKRITAMGTLDQDQAKSPGLCIQCSQEIVRSHDWNELMKHVNVLERKLEQSKIVENKLNEEIYSKTKMMEEAQLEMTRAYIEKDRLKADLMASQTRWEDQLNNIGQVVASQCHAGHQLTIDKLLNTQKMNKELMTKLAKIHESLETCNKENKLLSSEVCELRRKCSNSVQEFNVLTDVLKIDKIQARSFGDNLQQQVEMLSAAINQCEQERDVERMKSRQQIDSLGKRLFVAEKTLTQNRNEIIEMHEHKQQLLRKIDYLERSRIHIEKEMVETTKKTEHIYAEREAQTNKSLLLIQKQYVAKVSQMEEGFQTYKSFSQELKNECKVLVKRLEDALKEHRSDIKKLKDENKILKMYFTLNQNEAYGILTKEDTL